MDRVGRPRLVALSAIPLYGALRQDYLPTDVDEAEFSVQVNGPEGSSFASFDDAVRAGTAPAYWADDGVHPTPQGHQRMADAWIAAEVMRDL